MPIIEKCSEYNVRVIKKPDFKNKVHGYNFAYPVMNTIDIGIEFHQDNPKFPIKYFLDDIYQYFINNMI